MPRLGRGFPAKPFISKAPPVAGGPHNYTQTLTGGLSFVGSQVKFTTYPLVAGGLSFAGSIAKQTLMPLTGGLSFVGAFAKRAGKAMTGGLSFVGAIAKLTSYPLTANLSFSGAFTKFTTYPLVAAALSFSGSIAKRSGKALSALLVTSGGNNLVRNSDFEYAPGSNVPQTVQNWFDGTSGGSATNTAFGWAFISTGGTASAVFDNTNSHLGTWSLKLSTTAVSSTVVTGTAPTGGVITIPFIISALPNTAYTLTFWQKTNFGSGAATTGANVIISERDSTNAQVTSTQSTGVQTTTAWTQRTINITTSATTRFLFLKQQIVGNDGTGTLIMDSWFDDFVLSYTAAIQGSFTKRTSIPMTAALSFVGNMFKLTAQVFAAGLSFIGNFATFFSHGGILYTQALAGGLSFVGSFAKQTSLPFTGGLSFVGSIAKFTSYPLAAAVSFVGAIAKSTSYPLSAAVSFSGSFAKTTLRSLAASVSFVGSIGKRIGKALVAAGLAFAGALATFKNHTGTLYTITFNASLKFVGHFPYSAGVGRAQIILLADGRLAKWLGGILYLPL